MKTQVSFLCLLAVGALASKSSVTPVQKVISLLNGMLEKGKKEKHEEEVMWAQTRQFCGDTEAEKKVVITEELEDIENLDALINKDEATVEHLRKLISLLHEDQDKWSGDIDAAEKVREIEHADFQKTHEDYEQSIDALGRAIDTLKKPSADRKQAEFLQVGTLQGMNLIPEGAKRTLGLFLQQGDSDESLTEGAPEANAYEFQSHGVIDMLNKLLDKFVDEKTNLEKEEANSKNAFDLLLQELHAEIKEAVKDQHLKEENKGETMQREATEKGDKQDTETTEIADEKFLSKLQASCNMKEEDFHARQQLRGEEIEAIEKAIEIISSGAVSGAADKHLPQLVQTEDATSLSQLRSDSNVRSGLNNMMQQRVAVFLQGRSKKLDSRLLAAAAAKIAEDPFSKVKKMLKDLVVKLMEEANEEAEHKGWCDTELSTNEQTRKEKTDSVEKLHSAIDELEASISKLTEEISNLTQELAELDAAVAKSTKMRQEEKAKNTETMQDAQDAQTAVAQALTVLREFYAKAAEATALVQAGQAEPYKGMQGGNGGVVGMLEVIESDFARLESETKAAEASGQKEYDGFMEDSKINKAQKSTDVEHKTSKKEDQSNTLISTKEDLEGTQKELDAALQYFDKLKPTCVDSGESYEDRVARRKEEIESMQEALKILNGEDIAL